MSAESLKAELEPHIQPGDEQPFEPWEQVQVALLATVPGVSEEQEFFQTNPAYWRAFRRVLKARSEAARQAANPSTQQTPEAS